jgi:hypothetical protein
VNPDLADAVESLAGQGAFAPETARLLSRVARGELVSVQLELRALIYGGVLVAMSGVGLLLKDNLNRIGPLSITAALALVAAACLGWVAAHAPPFSWGEAPAKDLAFDYILLLGVLLAGADLAYFEAEFTPLGRAWAIHLLVVSLFTGALAIRFDSRLVFSLALSSFAAWRGVSMATLEGAFWPRSAQEDGLRANALLCGLLFLVLGSALARSGRKPHFEPVATHLGWALCLGAWLSGLGRAGPPGMAYALALLVTGVGLGAVSFARRRFSLFVMGVLGGYVGLSSVFLKCHPGVTLGFGWFLVTSGGVLVGLLLAHRRMGEPA